MAARDHSAVPVPPKWVHFAPNPRPALTDAQARTLAELQARVGARHAGSDAATRAFLCPNTYSRYLWAHGFKLETAEENLEATIAWRKTFIHPKLHCDACVEDSQSHCFLRLGHDRWSRPIVYFCPGRNKTTDKEMTARHTISEMEAAFAKAGSAENWVFIMDLRGFSVFGSATQSAKEMAGVRSIYIGFADANACLRLDPELLPSARVQGFRGVAAYPLAL